MTNPYEPPSPPPGPDSPPMPGGASVRPTAVTVFGILNIIFGAMALACGPLLLIALFIPLETPPGELANPTFELLRNPAYINASLALGAVGFVASAVQVAAGIGLLRMREWGRILSIWLSLYRFVAVAVASATNYVYLISPLLTRANQGNDTGASAAANVNIISTLGGGLLGLIYSALLLYFMTRSNVVRALRPVEPADAEAMDAF